MSESERSEFPNDATKQRPTQSRVFRDELLRRAGVESSVETSTLGEEKSESDGVDILTQVRTTEEDAGGDIGETLLKLGKSDSRSLLVDEKQTMIIADTIASLDGVAPSRSGELSPLVQETGLVADAIATVIESPEIGIEKVDDAVFEYAKAVHQVEDKLNGEKKSGVWSMLRNRFKSIVGVGDGELKSVAPVDLEKPQEPETFIERVANTMEVAKRYRNRFGQLLRLAKAAGYEDVGVSDEMKKRLAKESLFLLSLRNPLLSVNKVQDIFFPQRKGAPGRDPEGTPIAEKDKVLAYSESASFFKYAELGSKYKEAIEQRGEVSKSEQTAYAVRSMLEIAASDKKDKFHILPRRKILNIWNPQPEGRDVTFMIYHKDAPYKLTVPVEKGKPLPSVEMIKESINFMDFDDEPLHKISRNNKIKLRKIAYSREKKHDGVVKALGKVDFAIVVDDRSPKSADERRRNVNAADSLALTYGRETKAVMVLQFNKGEKGQVASGIDMKFSHPWFNGKDAGEMQFDIAMRMNARAMGKLSNSEGAKMALSSEKINIKEFGSSTLEMEYWDDDRENLIGLNPEEINWGIVSAEQLKKINERIGNLKKRGVPLTLGSLTAFGQAIAVGSKAFHQTYHCNRTDELDIALGVVPKQADELFLKYDRKKGVEEIRKTDESLFVEVRNRMKNIALNFDEDKKNVLDGRGMVSTMAATAGMFEGVLKPLAEYLTGDMKRWVANPGTMSSMLLSGYDKTNPDSDVGERDRKKGVGNMDTYTRLGFEGHTTEYMIPEGFDTAQTESYLHKDGKGVMGGSEVYRRGASGDGVESRDLMLSMRVDLEQSTKEVSGYMMMGIGAVDPDKRDAIREEVRAQLLMLSEMSDDSNVDALTMDAKIREFAAAYNLSPEGYVTLISNSMRRAAINRIARTYLAMNFVLDMLEAE